MHQLISLFVIGVLASSGARVVPMKCPNSTATLEGYGEGRPVVLYGDSVLSPDRFEGILSELEFGVIELGCWNPENAEFGGASGVPVIRLVPKAHWDDLMSKLDAISAAQSESWAQSGSFTTRPSDMLTEPFPIRRMETQVGPSSWRVDVFTDFVECELRSVSPPEDRRPSVCRWNDDVQSQVMVRLFDRIGGGA